MNTTTHAGSGPQQLAAAGNDAIRAYEDAATAIGRLDATAKLAAPGLRELLVLRCIATPSRADHFAMIGLLRPEGEGDATLRAYGRGLREGAARARGGALPSLASLHALLQLPSPSPAAAIDDLLRDAHERTPPLLKAAFTAAALHTAAPHTADETGSARLIALCVTLVLCVGGVTTDAWLTLPRSPVQQRAAGRDFPLRETFAALAREARAAEQGLATARDRCDLDENRVRESLGRAAYSALDVLALLREEIIITVPDTARILGLTPPTAGAAVARLVDLRIASEVTGKARSRAFAYAGIVRALEPESDGKP